MPKSVKLCILIPLILWLVWWLSFYALAMRSSDSVMGLVFAFFPLVAGTLPPIVYGTVRAMKSRNASWTALGIGVFMAVMYVCYSMFFRGQIL